MLLFGLRINIIPIPGLQAVHDIDGFLSADMGAISVDQYVFENRPARYRFTLAHEIAHLVIHGDRLKEVAPKSIPDWKQFVRELPERDYAWLEWQAYAFGGLVLAPRGPLLAAHDEAVQAAREAGIDPAANLDFARDSEQRPVAGSDQNVGDLTLLDCDQIFGRNSGSSRGSPPPPRSPRRPRSRAPAHRLVPPARRPNPRS